MIEEKGGQKWLEGLRGQDLEKVNKELTSLMGVGNKVADCIALFSLDCTGTVPVDTHVF
jgi:N-glycosylase/DNA lyase